MLDIQYMSDSDREKSLEYINDSLDKLSRDQLIFIADMINNDTPSSLTSKANDIYIDHKKLPNHLVTTIKQYVETCINSS